jgi:hypothetical protein
VQPVVEGFIANDPDCVVGRVLAIAGNQAQLEGESVITVHFMLITDASSAVNGVVRGVYLEPVWEGSDLGQYRKAMNDDNEEWEVTVCDHTACDIEEGAMQWNDVLAGVNWVDDDNEEHGEWDATDSLMSSQEWDMITNEFNTYKNTNNL